MGSIKHMPEALHSAVRSGIILYDFTRVVEELLFNSLDAGATKVHVALDVSTCYVKVKDNGSGITRDGLVLAGQRYATSKHHHMGDMLSASGSFGFRGEALCSISDVALLEITTRTHGMPNGYRKVIKGCKCLYLGISDETFDVGTTVVVRDLFYNQPVRRKHIQSSPKKVLHSVKNCILRIALVHPRVFFRVIDIESENEVLSAGPSSSPLTLLTSGFGIDTISSFRELKRSDGILNLSGYVSVPCDFISSKVFQYIYINSRFVCKGPIHKLINQLALRFISIDVWKPESSSHSPQLSPAFFLNLICQRSLYDITLEPSRTTVEFKDWGAVLTLIENALSEFWGESEPHALSLKHIGRKRRRLQSVEGSLQLSPSPPRKLNQDHTSLPSWSPSQDSFEKYIGDASDVEDHIAEDGCFSQVDHAHKSYDRPQSYLEGVIGVEYSNSMQNSHCSFSNGDIFSENELFAPERPFKLVKCNRSTWEKPTTIDARIGDISEESFDCRAFHDGIDDMIENQKPFLNDGLSGQHLLDYESPFEGDDTFKLRTDCFRTKDKWDVHDDGFRTGELDNLDKIISARSSVHGDLPSPRSFLISRIQHSKKIYDDSFSENLQSSRNPFSSPVIDEDEFYHLPSDLAKPMRESFDSHLSPIAADPFFGDRLHVDFCSDEDEGGIYFEPDKSLSNGCYYGSGIPGEIAQENCGTSRFTARKSHVYIRDDSWKPGDSYMKSDIIDETDRISSQMTGNEICTNFPMAGNHSSSMDCERNVYVFPIRSQVKQSDSRKRATRCHSAPPIYRGRKRFLAVGDLYMMSEAKPNSPVFHDKPNLPERRVKHAENYSKSSRWKCSPQSPSQSHLFSVGNPATTVSDVKTTSGVALIQDYVSHGKDNGFDAWDYDPQEDCKLKSREQLFDSETNQQDMLLKSTGRNMSIKNEHEASILDISSGILHLSGDSLVPNSIDKSFLERAKVLQQVDKKYIPAVGCKVLAIIDQHAADERIRLEELRKQVLSGEMKTITYLETEQDLVLPEIGFQLLHDYSEEIQSWGWICNIHSQNSESFTKNMKILHSHHPTITRLLAVPCILGVNLTDGDMLEYLQQLADTDGSSRIPPSVNRILNNKACRGAIMFGDALLPSECSLIVEELKRTSLCFQCAHGRPTTVPLVNMDMLHKHIANMRLASNSSDSWHGLHRHKVSLERASQRIS